MLSALFQFIEYSHDFKPFFHILGILGFSDFAVGYTPRLVCMQISGLTLLKELRDFEFSMRSMHLL